MSTIKVGQVWQDKDKRRNTVIEIISVPSDKRGDAEIVGLVVGTEETRSYKEDRLLKRWELVTTKNPTLTDDPATDDYIEKMAVPKPKHKTREQWLQAAVAELTKKVFKPHDIKVPEIRVSVGWPGGRGKKQGVIGQCFATRVTEDKVAQIFVSPVVTNPVEVVETLAHELVHAVDDCESGHKKNFVKIAKQIGFLAPWKSTPANDELHATCAEIAEKLGTYPHAAIRPEDRPKVQKTYMVLVESVDCDDCEDGYKLRMTQKWLDEVGAPLCPHHVEMVPKEK